VGCARGVYGGLCAGRWKRRASTSPCIAFTGTSESPRRTCLSWLSWAGLCPTWDRARSGAWPAVSRLDASERVCFVCLMGLMCFVFCECTVLRTVLLCYCATALLCVNICACVCLCGRCAFPQCEKYMWSNVLYLNNLVPFDNSLGRCMDWSWYLANDFQFFLVTPAFVWLYAKRRVVGVVACAAALVGSVVALGIHSHRDRVFSVYDLLGYVAVCVRVCVHVSVCVEGVSASPNAARTRKNRTHCRSVHAELIPRNFLALCCPHARVHPRHASAPCHPTRPPSFSPSPPLRACMCVCVCVYVCVYVCVCARARGVVRYGFGNNSDIYCRPWFRIQSYLPGILAAMAWHEYRPALLAYFKDGGRRLVGWAVFTVLLAAAATLFYSTRSFYAGEHWSDARLAAYTCLSRPVWASLVMALCLLWFANPSNLVARLMSAGVW
jgi:hypothetical protein